jgi:hypothetical protein
LSYNGAIVNSKPLQVANPRASDNVLSSEFAGIYQGKRMKLQAADIKLVKFNSGLHLTIQGKLF